MNSISGVDYNQHVPSLVVGPEVGFDLCLNVKNVAHEKGTLPTELHVKSDMCTVSSYCSSVGLVCVKLEHLGQTNLTLTFYMGL